ncbi:MAG: PilN domain-containing protein [Candidatus Omnitrophica bacterium]|nr:PilN domain-containing protein [Candidatus Omnitrophota bacterium]
MKLPSLSFRAIKPPPLNLPKVGGKLKFPPLFRKRPKAAAAGAASGAVDAVMVNIEEHEVKMALASSSFTGGREISKVITIPSQAEAGEDLTPKFVSALSELGAVNPEMVGVISSHWVVTRNIEIPSKDPHEIREIINLQAVRHTPYARNEIVVEYLNLGVYKSVYSKVLLIIVPRATVARYYELAARLNLKIGKVVFGPEAVARNLFKLPQFLTLKTPICLVRFDTADSEFMIIHKGTLLFVRSIPIGAQHFSVAKEGYLLRFVEELKQSLETYQSESIEQNPAAIYALGATKGLEDLDQLVEDNLKMSVKRLLDMEGIPVRKDVANVYSEQNVSYGHLMASGILAEEMAVDLTPEEGKLKKSVEEWSKEFMKTGILGMALFAMLCAYFLSYVLFQKVRVDELKKRYEPIRNEASILEEAYARVRAVKYHQESVGRSIETVAVLSDAMPGDTYVTNVRLDDDGKFTVRGMSSYKASIFTLVDNLESSELFRNVQTKYITGKVEEDKEIADFELVAFTEQG